MGFAPFFDRATQGAAQVLREFNVGTFAQRLTGVVVRLVFDRSAERSREARSSLDMAARLIARLYPLVQVEALDGDSAFAAQLRTLMRSINPNIEFVDEVGSRRRVSVVAGDRACANGTSIYMGSDRWNARVSTKEPVGSNDSVNPFGAGAAGCIAIANLFRAVFADWLPKPELDEDVTLSLLNFELAGLAINGDLPERLDFGLLQLVGVGAIGNAFVWSMARTNGIFGTIDLIDPQAVELSNLQRYVLTSMADVKAAKVELAGDILVASDINAACYATDWSGYIEIVGHHRFERVAVALDTVRDRIQVQGALPRRLFNAWTQAGDLGVSRHGFDGAEACLACLYLPTGKRRNEDEIVAEELGFKDEAKRLQIRAMLHFGGPVGELLVGEIAANLGIDVGTLLPFADLPLRAFRQKGICGNAILKARDARSPDLEVPMAFQSALAGVMLAAEVVASLPALRQQKPATRSVVDLMRRLPGRITFPVLKATSGLPRCICQDPDYIEVYRAKYADVHCRN